jgi:glycerol transport system permease protein
MSSAMRRQLGLVGIYVLWIGLTLLVLVPIYWLFLVSSRSPVELFGSPSFAFTGFWPNNFAKLLADNVFRGYLFNSIIVATTNAVLVAVLALFATYALSRWKLPGADNIFFWTITNRMGPPAAFLLPIYLLWTKYFYSDGLTFDFAGLRFNLFQFQFFDNVWGLILLYCVFNLPFAIWLMKGIMDGIPTEIDEAAFVDGAGRWTVLWRIITPLAAPGLAITAILSWVFAWNEYLFAATLTSVEARTITTRLAEYVTTTGTNWGEMAAVAVIALLPALLFLAFVQRYIVIGLTFGAVKE